MSLDASLAGLVAVLGSSYQMTNSFISGWAIRDALDEGPPDAASSSPSRRTRVARLRSWAKRNSVSIAGFTFAITALATISSPSPWSLLPMALLLSLSVCFLGVLLVWPHLIFTVESVREPTERQLAIIRQQAPNAAGWMIVVVAGMLTVISTSGKAEWPVYATLVAMWAGTSTSFLANRKVREDRAAVERAELAARSLPPLPSETEGPQRRFSVWNLARRRRPGRK